MADPKRIAKNTLYMYLRMILVMAVYLYTSRVVIDKLGVDDYGLYNAVASVVAFVAFINQTLSTSTSRFLTYDIGLKNDSIIKETFSTAFFTHILLALFVVLIMETLGLWYMSSKFVIPEGRSSAAFIVFHISVLMSAISISVVPYKSVLISYEDMNIYAYIGVFEAVAQLVVALIIAVSPIDKLICYALLLLIVQILVSFLYVTICIRKYPIIKLKKTVNKGTLNNMIRFSGWTALANLSNSLTNQGGIILLNLFFAPAIIAAKAISDQVGSAINMFVNNFRTALNPQIIKSYAANEIEESKDLTLKSTIIAFDLMMILGLPFIFTMETVLSLWLVEVPRYAVTFTRITILTQILGTISTSTYIAFVSSGKLSSNAIWGVITGGAYFVILYLIFKVGGDASWVQYLSLVSAFLWVILLRPFLLKRDVNYSPKEVFLCYWSCLKVFIPSIITSFLLSLILPDGILFQVVLFVGVLIICVLYAYVFMDKGMKIMINSMIKGHLPKFHNK